MKEARHTQYYAENPVYEPAEDSFLIRKHIRDYAKGAKAVLDMGTGSGILAEEAAVYAKKVYAADINKKALEYSGKRLRKRGISFIESDLFSAFRKGSGRSNDAKQRKNKGARRHRKFDIIIFNPPYLPDHPKVKDLALDGGKHGYELTLRFLSEAIDFLKPDGKILLLFSSFTKKEKVDDWIERCGYVKREIDRKRIDFEVLYVYVIEKSPVLKAIEKKGVRDITYLAKGHRGIIFTGHMYAKDIKAGVFGTLGKRPKRLRIAVKAKLPVSEAVGRMENESRVLKILNRHGMGPNILFAGNSYFAYLFVEGDFIEEHIEKSTKEETIRTLKEVFLQMRALDVLMINKEEMHHPPKHIIIGKKGKVTLIDFERAGHTEKPHNVTQFCQYIIRLGKVLEKKGIAVDKDRIIALSKEYKKSMSNEAFSRITSIIN